MINSLSLHFAGDRYIYIYIQSRRTLTTPFVSFLVCVSPSLCNCTFFLVICNSGHKSVVLRSSDGKEGIQSNVQGHALFVKVVWGCLSRILLTYCVELLLLEHGHGLERGVFCCFLG